MIRKAKKLAWRRMYESDARRLLAAAQESAEQDTGHGDRELARQALVVARAIVSEGGMQLCEAYRDVWIADSHVPVSRYVRYRRARELAPVRVGSDDGGHVWWYRESYYIARPDLRAHDVVRFAHLEKDRERRSLERFRAEVAAASRA